MVHSFGKNLRQIFWQLPVALVVVALELYHWETRGIYEWGYEIVVCALIATGTSVNLSIKILSGIPSRKELYRHLLRLAGSITVLWLSYLLFEEVFFRYSSIRHSVIFQNIILPFLIIAVWLFILKFIYRLKRVFFAIFLVVALLVAIFIGCLSTDTLGEWYYLATSSMIVVFVFPVVVKAK